MKVDITKPEDVAAIVAATAVVFRGASAAVTYVGYRIAEHIHAPETKRQLDLGPFNDIPDGSRLRCLIVRYGRDEYLEHLAPAQDKFEGRLRNEIKEVKLAERCGSTYQFEASIPLHKRLGTQFKFFFEVKDLDAAEKLAKNKAFIDAHIAQHSRPFRVWFLVKDFEAIKTVEGYQNNFWPAI